MNLRTLLAATLGLSILVLNAAALENFNTFTAETYPDTDGFSSPSWVVADLAADGDGLIAGELTNSFPTVFYNDSDVLGSRISYLYQPGGDDDLTGLVLGFQPNDTTNAAIGEQPGASFLLFDWKRVEQNFDFNDPTGEGAGGIPNFNSATVGSTAPAAMRAAWVSGVPTSDELWGKESQDANSFGGVTAIGNAATPGGYEANRSYVMEIEYSADRVRLMVDGSEEFNLTPADVDGIDAFPNGRFGFYEAYQSPGSIYSQLDIRPLTDGAAPAPQPISRNVAELAPGVKAFRLDVVNEDAASGAASWSVAASTGDANQAYIITNPNNGDVDIAYGMAGLPDPRTDDNPRIRLGLDTTVRQPAPSDGVMIATIAENGGRLRDDASAAPIYGTVEAPYDSGFGGVGYGLAIAEAIDGSESTTSVAAAFFPYTDGWIGGSVSDAGQIVAGNGAATVTQLMPPAPSMQNGVFNVAIDGVTPESGMLFVVGASNENNLAGAAVLSDGTWNVAVRDNNNVDFNGVDEFEADDFNFVFVGTDTQGLIGGQVTGFDAADASAELALSGGDFDLTRVAEGQYRLTIDGETPESGMLLLTNNTPTTLSDGTVAASNQYLTYGMENDGFLIEMRQLVDGAEPTLVDGQFSFAFVSYSNPMQVPEPSALGLFGAGALALLIARRRR